MTLARCPPVATALAALALAGAARAQPGDAASVGNDRPGVARLEVVRRGAAERDCPDAAALATLVDTVANRPAIARAPARGDAEAKGLADQGRVVPMCAPLLPTGDDGVPGGNVTMNLEVGLGSIADDVASRMHE